MIASPGVHAGSDLRHRSCRGLCRIAGLGSARRHAHDARRLHGHCSVGEIEAGLLGAGIVATMPVAIVERACCDDERTTVTQLDALVRVVEREAIRSPAILIIGDVAARRLEKPASSRSNVPFEAMPERAVPAMVNRARCFSSA
jgi:hypothetical protein